MIVAGRIETNGWIQTRCDLKTCGLGTPQRARARLLDQRDWMKQEFIYGMDVYFEMRRWFVLCWLNQES